VNPRTKGAAHAAGIGCTFLKFAGRAVRVVLLAVLLTLEPLVRCVLWMLSLLSLLTALFIQLSGAVPDFPFWLIVGFAVGCTLVRMVYERVIRALAT
jgi:hypothetical protein